jgi:signal transduction histidine kinase
LALTLLATLGEPLLPSLTTSFVRYTPATYLAAAPALLLLIAAIVTLLRGRRSELDLWLLLVLWGWFLETVLANFSFGRFTLGWYAGQLMNMASSQFVLFTLIAETNTLYALSVQQLTAERQDRESRLLTRDAVAAFIAHELRQPLSAILLNAQVMQNSPAGRGEEMAELLADVVACSLRANDMIQSTRAIFRHQPGDKQAVDLGLLLRSTLAMVESSARALDVSVELALERQPKPINANRLQIQQVLLNLFQNAIEALSRVNERRRALTVRCIPSEEDGVTIRVEDNGPGIAQADRERIFDAFFTTRADGSGLGLAITRMVVEAHGGQISVEPLSPFGTAFVIRLPYDGGEAD